MQQNVQTRLAALLREASAAHSAYEARELNGSYDQDWPAWHADYLLQHGFGDLVGSSTTPEELNQLLRRCDDEYASGQQSEDWPEFYARLIVAQQMEAEQR